MIDPDPDQRKLTTAVLAEAGIACESYVDGRALLAGYRDRGPACVITALRMPGMSGLDLMAQLREHGVLHPVIVTTEPGEVEGIIQAFRQGAVDAFVKPLADALLRDRAINAIQLDRAARLKRSSTRSLREKLARLSSREHEVMGMLLHGVPNKEIAWRLKLSDKTIAAHRANLLSKMEAQSLAELITLVVRHEEGVLMLDQAKDRAADRAA